MHLSRLNQNKTKIKFLYKIEQIEKSEIKFNIKLLKRHLLVSILSAVFKKNTIFSKKICFKGFPCNLKFFSF